MCELFAMSSKQPADVDRYLSLLMPRGGDIGPHADGWGVAYYEGHASRIFKDAAPAAYSRYLRMLSKAKLKSTSVIAHIRRANPSSVGRAAANTHPFEREWNGYSWVFAHNGKLPGIGRLRRTPDCRFSPLGRTDSELAFCHLLEALASNIGYDEPLEPERVAQVLQAAVQPISLLGEFNFILSNGDYMFVYAHTHLHLLEQNRRSEQVLFATAPLTGERWRVLSPGSLGIYQSGKSLAYLEA